MRRSSLRWGFAALALALMAAPGSARAETDTFGLGNGHNGAKTVAAGVNAPVNSYASLTADAAVGASTLTFGTVIGDPVGFAAGDLVLVWRATGIATVATGSQARVDVPSAASTPENVPGLVGLYEFARIQTVAGGTITLTKPLLKAFTRNVSQVVRVPEYTTVDIAATGSIVATAWQEIGGAPELPDPTKPWAGGIAIFLATGTITNNGTIHADGRGFHGGLPVPAALAPVLGCNGNAPDGNPLTGAFAPKGEGIAHSQHLATVGGKNNISMAGGGGNCFEGGGGGGANSGNGGIGSSSILGFGAGGLGGVGVDYDILSRLSMGGGGGAGRQIVNLLSQVSFGGFGGGVVYIRGASMAGATGKLSANGASAAQSGLLNLPAGVVGEGAGGGGAGGTVVVRLTGNLDCDSLGSPGGNGGNAQVIGLNVFGSGGGGGGGRIFYQAASKAANCDLVVTPGNPGNNGGGGAQPGGGGGTQNPPGGPFCTVGPPSSCADPAPVCEISSGTCKPCSGPFGGGTALACPTAPEPVCNANGACAPCDGDLGTAAGSTCQLSASPYCFLANGGGAVAGSCGKCTANADCAGNHAGPICNTIAGSCGTSCTTDADCTTTQWCAPAGGGASVCTPKTPNTQPLPPFPPIDGECTAAKGGRACLSSVCEEADDLCGRRNSSPCGGVPECRSSICFSDALCGLPNGEPCTGAGQCRSAQCTDGTCTATCDEDADCKLGQVCDLSAKQCVVGCRVGVSAVDGGQVNGGCAASQRCVGADAGAIGQCQPLPPGADAGGVDDTSGIIEGGGCSCSTTISSATSPLAVLAGAAGVLLALRRRRSRKTGDVR